MHQFNRISNYASAMRGRCAFYGTFYQKPKFIRMFSILCGHVNTFRTFYECDPSEAIHYKDIVSLYPFIMSTVKYPVGAPVIKTNPPLTELCLGIEGTAWVKAPMVAVYKAEFLAPTDRTFQVLNSLEKNNSNPLDSVWYPSLPIRMSDGRLLYALCGTCAKTKQQTACEHSESQRTFIGCYERAEVLFALSQRYTILRCFESWEWIEVEEVL